MMKVLSHLQTYEASAHNHGMPHSVSAEIAVYAVGVVHVAQREYALGVYSLERRTHGLGSRREQQAVVGLAVCGAVGAPYAHLMPLRVDGESLVPRAHIDIEPSRESLRCLHEQLVAALYHTAYIIRKTAVGIRYILTLFHENNLRVLVGSSYACRGGGSACDSANDDMFHNMIELEL